MIFMKKVNHIMAILGWFIFLNPLFGNSEIYEIKNGRAAFIQVIKQIKDPIILGAYKINPSLAPDPDILEAFKQRKLQGLTTTTILESNITEEEKHGPQSISLENALQKYQEAGVDLVFLSQFKNAHTKIIASPSLCFIGNTNFDGDYPNRDTRDFTIKLENHPAVDLLFNTMEKLINNEKVNWNQFDYNIEKLESDDIVLSWGPSFHRKQILQMISMAQKHIKIYQQDMQDLTIINALEGALQRGIKVEILMSKHPFSEKNPNKSLPNLQKIVTQGGEVRLTGIELEGKKPVHIHAKAMVIDNTLMYLGSANFYPDIMEPEKNNLNVGVITNKKDLIDFVLNHFTNDWKTHENSILEKE